MKKILKDCFTVVFGAGVGRGLSFFTTLLLARFLGAHGFGIFSVFFTIMMLVWQIPGVIDAIYVRYAKVGTNKDKTEYIRTAFLMKGALFILLQICAYPVAFLLAHYVFNKPEIIFYLVIAIISGAFLSLFTSLGSIFQAEGSFSAFAIVNAFFYVIVFFSILIILLFKFNITPVAAALVYSVSAFVAGILVMIYLYNLVKPLVPTHRPLLYDMIHFGKWLLGVGLVEIFLQRLDVLFLTRFTTYEQLGIYSVAVRMAMFATILTSSSTVIFMPRGCESLRSAKHLKSYFKESIIVTFGLTLPILALIIISPVVIKILFGLEYIHCLVSARILLLESIFVLLYTPFTFLFYATGNTRQIFYFMLARTTVAVVSLFLFVPKFGLAGAASSIALSSFLGLLLIIVMSSKVFRSAHDHFQNCEEINKMKLVNNV